LLSRGGILEVAIFDELIIYAIASADRVGNIVKMNSINRINKAKNTDFSVENS
jgi:hypothetical protein